VIPSDILSNNLYSSVVGNQGYYLNVIGVFANDNDMTSYAENTAVIDSGTSLFYFNPSLYNQFVQQYLQGCQSTNNLFFLCNCTTNPMPTLKFLFPGVQVTLPNNSYVTPTNNGKCQVYINTLSTTSTTILLGDTLFLNNIVTFNKNQATVGFCGTDVGPHPNPSPSPPPVPVPIVGSDHGFVVSQYIMLGFSVIALIVLIILGIIMKVTPESELKLQIN
jgi:hypothetical protein